MDCNQNDVDQIERGLENTYMNKTNDSEHDENTYESELEIPTFGFTEKSWRSDFVLIVEGTRLYVNKAMLYLASPVFDTMFQSDFKEGSCDELELPEKKLRDVADFLRYIYPRTLTQMTPESALNVLPLVEEYQVLHLKQRCETAILAIVNEETTIEDLFRILRVACIYNLVYLRKQCVRMVCNKSQEDIYEEFGNNPPPAVAAQEILEEINRKLRNTICEQKQLIDDMSRQATESIDEQKEIAETFKAKSVEQEKQLDILKQYLSRDVKQNKVFSLDSDSNWNEEITIFDIIMNKEDIKSIREVNIWNVQLVICISIRTGNGHEKFLRIEIRNTGDKIISKLKGRAIIVNRQPMGKNETVLFDSLLTSCYPSYNCVRKDLMNLSRINDIENGFLSGGHIGMIVQIYMSEPNRA